MNETIFSYVPKTNKQFAYSDSALYVRVENPLPRLDGSAMLMTSVHKEATQCGESSLVLTDGKRLILAEDGGISIAESALSFTTVAGVSVAYATTHLSHEAAEEIALTAMARAADSKQWLAANEHHLPMIVRYERMKF